jgi:hypothetical protein
VRGSMMSVSNVLPGRDPAVCLHIILLHDSFIFVSEQQSVNLPRHALVCKGGVQLREYPGGVKAALALIGLEEKVVIVEGPRVDDPMNILARLKLAQVRLLSRLSSLWFRGEGSRLKLAQVRLLSRLSSLWFRGEGSRLKLAQVRLLSRLSRSVVVATEKSRYIHRIKSSK